MCLIIDKERTQKVKIKHKVITCYKILRKIRGKYYSPWYDLPYKGIVKSEVTRRNYADETNIDEGLHVFTSKKDAIFVLNFLRKHSVGETEICLFKIKCNLMHFDAYGNFPFFVAEIQASFYLKGMVFSELEFDLTKRIDVV